jgi:hypothetical protein
MCPIVPMLQWGFARENFAFAIINYFILSCSMLA